MNTTHGEMSPADWGAASWEDAVKLDPRTRGPWTCSSPAFEFFLKLSCALGGPVGQQMVALWKSRGWRSSGPVGGYDGRPAWALFGHATVGQAVAVYRMASLVDLWRHGYDAYRTPSAHLVWTALRKRWTIRQLLEVHAAFRERTLPRNATQVARVFGVLKSALNRVDPVRSRFQQGPGGTPPWGEVVPGRTRFPRRAALYAAKLVAARKVPYFKALAALANARLVLAHADWVTETARPDEKQVLLQELRALQGTSELQARLDYASNTTRWLELGVRAGSVRTLPVPAPHLTRAVTCTLLELDARFREPRPRESRRSSLAEVLRPGAMQELQRRYARHVEVVEARRAAAGEVDDADTIYGLAFLWEGYGNAAPMVLEALQVPLADATRLRPPQRAVAEFTLRNLAGLRALADHNPLDVVMRTLNTLNVHWSPDLADASWESALHQSVRRSMKAPRVGPPTMRAMARPVDVPVSA